MAETALVGRAVEQRALDDLLDAVRRGDGRALVLAGEAGVGLTALLGHLASRATAAGTRILRCAGTPSETELPFAGLHQLLGPAGTEVDRLVGPERAALRVVLGLDDGDVPDASVLASGLLALAVGRRPDRPVVCLVDDVPWLDRPTVQVLASVAGRLASTPVGIVLATREAAPPLDGLPRLEVRGLDPADALRLLDDALPAPLDDAVRHRHVAESGGNPRALLELPRRVGPVALAGGFTWPAVAPDVPLDEGHRRRLAALPDDARSLLLLAAADPVGDPTVLRAAGGCLGLGPRAIAGAVDGEFLEIGRRVRFTRPPLRGAVYRAASPAARRAVHLALAEVTDPDEAPDRRAWHRSLALVGPDEDTARALERSVDRARTRGGVAAAAAFLLRAAVHSHDLRDRVDRTTTAAGLTLDAGDPDRALELLDAVADAQVDEAAEARIAAVRGHVALARGRAADAVPLFRHAARLRHRQGLPGADDAVLDAVIAATWAAAAPDPVDDGTGPADRLADGLRARRSDGPAAAAPVLRRALDALVAGDGAGAPSPAVGRTAVALATELWDEASGAVLLDRYTDAARHDGALGVLRGLLPFQVLHRLSTDGVDAARRALDEERGDLHAVVAAWAGEDDVEVGSGRCPVASYTRAVLGNARGDADGALAAVAPLFRADRFGVGPYVLVEFVDAASRAGARTDLADAEQWIAERARATPTSWSRGIAELVRALTRKGDEARAHYERSVEHLSRRPGRLELARTLVLFGEWLRRRGSRGEARDRLRRAHDLFTALGASGFADRAARELRAAGDAADRDGAGVLTPQESRVAELAVEGLTTPQIAARLFLSPRTVQHHLRQAYGRLGINSRTQLGRALAAPGTTPPPAADDGRPSRRTGPVPPR